MPNLKKIGLLPDRLLPKYDILGVSQHIDSDSDFETSWEELSKPLEVAYDNKKRFKDMFEDAPVNATGVAVSTDKPIVRKKKKKEDSGYREIGTPELLKRYMDDTPSVNE